MKNRVHYKRIDEGFYEVYLGNHLLVRLSKNPMWQHYPWQIELYDGKRYVHKSSYDCFSFSAAKQIIKEFIVPSFVGKLGWE